MHFEHLMSANDFGFSRLLGKKSHHASHNRFVVVLPNVILTIDVINSRKIIIILNFIYEDEFVRDEFVVVVVVGHEFTIIYILHFDSRKSELM